MTFSLTIFPAAEADVDSAAQFIAADSIPAAFRFYDAVEATFEQIREAPTRWSLYELDEPRLVGLRRRSVLKFPKYLIFYRVVGRKVEVIRVLHGARDIPAILSDELL